MAKLYNSGKGTFYDAFGSKIGTVEEVEWAGDSFNRDTTVATCNNASFTATCSLDSATLKSLNGVVGINGDGTLTCSKGTVGDWDVTFTTKDEMSSTINTVQEQLKKLQGQIDELKQEQKKRQDGIRCKLKTLKYEREVE